MDNAESNCHPSPVRFKPPLLKAAALSKSLKTLPRKPGMCSLLVICIKKKKKKELLGATYPVGALSKLASLIIIFWYV